MNPNRWRYGSFGKRRPRTRSSLGQQLGVAGEARREAPGSRSAGDDGGDRLRQPRRDRLVAAQDVVGVDPERPLRDLGGHRRVAVAIAADPRAPARGTAGTSGGRVPVRPASVGLAVGAGGRGPSPAATLGAVERRVDRSQDARDDAEQRLVEERERGPDLVERRHGATARRSAVRQSSVISSRSRRRASRSSAGVRCGSSRRASSRSTGGARAGASGGGPRSGGR